MLADARRQVPRSRPALRRHDGARDAAGAGPDAQGANGPRHYLPQAGLRDRVVAKGARRVVHAARHRHRRRPEGDASVHGHSDHGQRHRLAVRLGRPDSRDHRDGDPARLGSLRPHRRQQLHQARARDGEVEPGVDGRHGAVGVHRAPQADHGVDDDADPDGRGYLPEREFHQADRRGRHRHDSSGSRERGRPDRNQEDRRLRHGAWRRDGDALRRHADLVHGERPLRGGVGELRRARTSLPGRAVVGAWPGRRAVSRSWTRASPSCRIRRGWASS